jgi:hypothetical protein
MNMQAGAQDHGHGVQLTFCSMSCKAAVCNSTDCKWQPRNLSYIIASITVTKNNCIFQQFASGWKLKNLLSWTSFGFMKLSNA